MTCEIEMFCKLPSLCILWVFPQSLSLWQLQFMDSYWESLNYPEQHSQDVDVSDLKTLRTDTLPGVGTLASCLPVSSHLKSIRSQLNLKLFASAFQNNNDLPRPISGFAVKFLSRYTVFGALKLTIWCLKKQLGTFDFGPKSIFVVLKSGTLLFYRFGSDHLKRWWYKLSKPHAIGKNLNNWYMWQVQIKGVGLVWALLVKQTHLLQWVHSKYYICPFQFYCYVAPSICSF